MEESQKLKTEKAGKLTPKKKINTTGMAKKISTVKQPNQTKEEETKQTENDNTKAAETTTTTATTTIERKIIKIPNLNQNQGKDNSSTVPIPHRIELPVKRSNSTDLSNNDNNNDDEAQNPAKRLKSVVPPPLPELSVNSEDTLIVTPIQSPPSDFIMTPESSPVIGSAFLDDDTFQLPKQVISLSNTATNNNENNNDVKETEEKKKEKKEEEKEDGNVKKQEEEKMEEEKGEKEEKEQKVDNNQEKMEEDDDDEIDEKIEVVNEEEKQQQQQQQSSSSSSSSPQPQQPQQQPQQPKEQKEASLIITIEKPNISTEERRMKRMERFKEEITADDIVKIINKETLTEFLQLFSPHIVSQVDELLKHSKKEIVNGLKKKFDEKNVFNFFKQYL